MRNFLDHPAGWTPSGLAEIYDETSFWSARFGALLFDHLKILRGIRALDVGCGTGFPLIELAHVHGASSHFIGIDIWDDALQRARLKVGLHGLTNVDIIKADTVSMPFPNAHFDLVVSNIGINNFRNPPMAIRECRRVAKPGARLVLTTNMQGHFRALYALLDATRRVRTAGRPRRVASRRGTSTVPGFYRKASGRRRIHGFPNIRTKFPNVLRRRVDDAASRARKMVPRWLAASRRRQG